MPFMSGVDYLSLQSAMYAATIHLHRDDLEVQPESYQKCLWAANSMTALVRQLRDNDYDSLCSIISVSASSRGCCIVAWHVDFIGGLPQTGWRSAAEVYLRILAMPPQSLPTAVDVFEQQVDTLVSALQRLGLLFPVAGALRRAFSLSGS